MPDSPQTKKNNGRPRKGRVQNVLLLGLSGSGKSAVGKYLAQDLGMGFLDTDHFLESSLRKSIAEIFSEGGESRFREEESKCLRQLAGIRNHVIALGGGTAISDENWQLIQDLGVTVWLDVPTNRIARNLLSAGEIQKRPLLKDVEANPDAIERRLDALAKDRNTRFEQAEFTVYSDHNDISNTCGRIKDQLFRRKR